MYNPSFLVLHDLNVYIYIICPHPELPLPLAMLPAGFLYFEYDRVIKKMCGIL
jgi:hypothetical protein